MARDESAPGGATSGAASTFRDELALLREEIDRLRGGILQELDMPQVVDRANFGVCLATRDGTVRYANYWWAALHGLTREECIGQPLSLFHAPDQLPQLRALTEGLARGESYSAVEAWHVRRSGEVFPLLVNAFLLKGSSGRQELFAITAVDMTGSKASEAALRESEERLKLAEEAAVMGYYQIEVATGHALWSDQTFRIFGLPPGTDAPKVEEYRSMIHPEDRSAVYALFEKCISERTRFDLVYRIIRSDGQERVVHSIGIMRRNSAGSDVMFGTFQDVTESHRATEALLVSEEKNRSLVQSSHDHIFMLDLNGTFMASNDRVQHYGLSSGTELIGRAVSEVCPPDVAALYHHSGDWTPGGVRAHSSWTE